MGARYLFFTTPVDSAGDTCAFASWSRHRSVLVHRHRDRLAFFCLYEVALSACTAVFVLFTLLVDSGFTSHCIYDRDAFCR